ncbi:MAG: hypothetical protein JSV22_06795 [Bacteroidales bacterium]|nr:MAG: hypothetical protein JSV22_06795 [Bacteroidales bacterium]
MEQRRFIFIPLIFILAVIISCKSGGKSETDSFDFDEISLEDEKNIMNSTDTIGAGLPIFYNMYLSVEMSSLFESIGAVFNADILNNTSKLPEYITSSKKALNIGVYAVDLSYSRIFEQIEFTSRYFNAMQKLSEELGIPSDYFLSTAQRFDRNINDKDSLIIIANEVYVTTDDYLRENERYSAAAQIILGGWTEALYIAMHIAKESKEIEVFERVSEQKYSLENLIEMLKNYDDDEVIGHYLSKLENMRESFNALNKEVNIDIEPDTEAEKKQIERILTTIVDLEKNINEIRGEIVG